MLQGYILSLCHPLIFTMGAGGPASPVGVKTYMENAFQGYEYQCDTVTIYHGYSTQQI